MHRANARLTTQGKTLLVRRVIRDGRPVSHVATELDVSRQCAHRWVSRFRAEGAAGLGDRSSRPRRTPTRTTPECEANVLEARSRLRFALARLEAETETGVPARTISRILTRHHVQSLAGLDPITGVSIRAARSTANRYERDRPGELVHIDVKKLGRMPDGGGWRVHGRAAGINDRKNRIGFDYVHAAVEDHTRLAYAEIHPDEKGTTAAGFLTRAAAYSKERGIKKIERVISDNAFAYRKSAAFPAAVAALGAKQKFIKPQCPWQNGKVERFDRTLATEWAYRYSLHHGSSTTTLVESTRATGSRPQPKCHQPDGSVQLGHGPAGRSSWGQLPVEEKPLTGRSRFLLGQPVAIFQLAQLRRVGLFKTRPHTAFDLGTLEPVGHPSLADPEILRDLIELRVVVPCDSEDVTRNSCGQGLGTMTILSRGHKPHRPDKNQIFGRTVRSGMRNESASRTEGFPR